MFEEFAEIHAGKLSLTHIYPGLVDGPGFYSDDMPRWFKIVWFLFKPILKMTYITSSEDCGQVMLSMGTSEFPAKGTAKAGDKVATSTKAESGGGSYAVGQRAEAPNKIMYQKVRKADTAKLVWDHTMGALNDIEKKNKAQ